MATLPGQVEPARKQPPKPKVAGLHYVYAAAPDGADSNLLILLHGLGDNEASFAQLGQQLQRGPGGTGGPLPQTATLAVRGPEPLPFFHDENRFLWWKAFSPLGEELPPNPQASLDALQELLSHLKECGWKSGNVHLLGFAQGGSIALELAILSARRGSPLGSVVTVDGPLVQHPTFTPPVSTPVLSFHRATAPALARAFANVTDLRAAPADGPAMPRASKGEWDGIIRWWAGTARWRNRSSMELSGEAVPLS